MLNISLCVIDHDVGIYLSKSTLHTFVILVDKYVILLPGKNEINTSYTLIQNWRRSVKLSTSVASILPQGDVYAIFHIMK